MVLTRAVGDVRGGACNVLRGWLREVRAAFSCRGFTGGGWWSLGRVGQCGSKVGGRLCGRFDDCSSGGRGSEFQGNRPNRQITADGASKDADVSRSWVGTTWPVTQKNNIPQTGVSLGAARSRPWARRMQL